MEKTNNENISPSIEFNVERVTKVLFAYNNQDDLLYLTEDDFKLLDKDGKLTNKFDENIFVQLASISILGSKIFMKCIKNTSSILIKRN